MIIEILKDNNLRGYTLEYVAKLLLRRERKNNFIFKINNFDNVTEIMSKYRLVYDNEKVIEFLNNNWRRTDLIEFVLNNTKERLVENIIVYDAKSKKQETKRVFEFCKSNYRFMSECVDFNIEAKVASMVVFEDWKMSFNIYNFKDVKKRVYTRFKGFKK